jgi:nucleoside-diphosphate-sugar epimerase
VKVFITGATGYIGGSLAAKLVATGHHVLGLVRQQDKAAQLKTRGIEPVLGTLADLSVVANAARGADAVVNAASSDDSFVADAIIEALAGSGKALLHTSGSSVVADRGVGEYSDLVFNEDSPFEPLPERLLRVAIERKVLLAAQRKVRSVVIRPTLIYGRGHGLNPNSVQLPQLVKLAKQHGVARHVGRGLNVWSHVHIDDVVDLYILALENAPAASVFFAENGEASWKSMASSIGKLLGYGAETKDWPVEDALREWGAGAITSYGSNSRVNALKARKMLGWNPSGPPLIQEIEHGCYREDFGSK